MTATMGGRGGGKTTHLINWLRAYPGAVAVVRDSAERERLVTRCADLAGRVFTPEELEEEAMKRIPKGTIIHRREGEATPYVPQIWVEPGVDVVELLHPERRVEALKAEITQLRNIIAEATFQLGGELRVSRQAMVSGDWVMWGPLPLPDGGSAWRVQRAALTPQSTESYPTPPRATEEEG